MRIGLIGLGDIAQKAYLPIMANYDGVIPVLCTRNAATLSFLARKYRIDECYTEINDLMRSGLDAAMVHSQTESHSEIVKQLLLAGIPTFVDKPISYHLEETQKLIELSDKTNVPLFVGFNRRYAPLITSINEPSPIHVSLQKNRPYLPGEHRSFIYDDFIHVIDSLRFLSSGKVENLHCWSRAEGNELGVIHAQWQSDQTLLTGNMNRISGSSKESLEIFGQQQTWQIDNLSEGEHYTPENINKLTFDNWQTTLYKRGFVDMLDSFIGQAKNKAVNIEQLHDIFKTHQLCDEILKSVNQYSLQVL